MSTPIPNVVQVHGGFVDGSGWLGVHRLLTADGFTVSIVQNLTLSLEGDLAATHFILDGVDGPAVLVGRSYGGAVISQAAVARSEDPVHPRGSDVARRAAAPTPPHRAAPGPAAGTPGDRAALGTAT